MTTACGTCLGRTRCAAGKCEERLFLNQQADGGEKGITSGGRKFQTIRQGTRFPGKDGQEKSDRQKQRNGKLIEAGTVRRQILGNVMGTDLRLTAEILVHPFVAVGAVMNLDRTV